jgi:hypothetical protein
VNKVEDAGDMMGGKAVSDDVDRAHMLPARWLVATCLHDLQDTVLGSLAVPSAATLDCDGCGGGPVIDWLRFDGCRMLQPQMFP